jgi:tetratricopeptide (TPR) repeat protein
MTEGEQEDAKLWEGVASIDSDIKVDALLQLSYNASGRNEYKESLAFCETAKEVYEGLGVLASNMKLAHIYFGIGFSLRHLNRPAEGARALAKSVQLYQEIGAEDALHILNEEGDAWYEAKEYQKSYEAYRKAIEYTNPDSCDSIVAINYADAGTALEKLKNWEDALIHFTEARMRYKKLKDLKSMSECDQEISLCHVWLGDGASALVHAQLSLDYAEMAEDQLHLMWAKARMALAKKTLGQYQDALEIFGEAKSLMVSRPNPPWKAVIKLERQVSDILKKLGRQEEAQEILRRISSFMDIFLDESEMGDLLV